MVTEYTLELLSAAAGKCKLRIATQNTLGDSSQNNYTYESGIDLARVLKAARLRGYKFNASKIREISYEGKIPVTKGQIEYEWRHLLSKLERRSPSLFKKYLMLHSPEPHPLFVIVPGGVEPWEKLRNYQT